jgi:predicted outer membrane lipoprotein
MYTDPTPLAMWIAGGLAVLAFGILIAIAVHDLIDARRHERRLADRPHYTVHTPRPREGNDGL